MLRKFGAEPPQEWRGAIASLNECQLQNGMRRMLYSGKTSPPTLPEFMRLCRTVGHDDAIPDPESRLPMLTHQQADIDKWEMAANKHLLAYIIKAVADKRKFTPEDVEALVKAKHAWATDMRDLDRGEGVPLEAQRPIWNDYVGLANGPVAGAA